MAVVRNLMIRAGADFSAMRREMQRANKNLSDFKTKVQKTMTSIGSILAATGIVFGIRAATREAMNFEASLQQINRLMGDNAQMFRRWADEQAAAFGMARSEAIRYGAVYANLISTFSSGARETEQRTEELLKASAVIASSTGRTIEDTMDRIRSGLLGNTEAIEDLGINVNVAMIESTEAFRQFAGDKSWQQLDFQTQQTIRYFAILEQSAKQYGNEIAQNTMSRQAAFVAQLKNAQLALGQAFLPIYNVILPALTRFATSLANTMNTIAQFTQALFGYNQAKQQVQMTEAQASAISELGDEAERAGKKAKGAVAGFDQLNLVGQASGAGAGGSAADVLAPADAAGGPLAKMGEQMNEVSQKARDMAMRVRNVFSQMAQSIRANSDLIIAALAGLAAGFTTHLVSKNWPLIIGGITQAFKGLRTAIITTWLAATGPVGLVVGAIAAIAAAFVYLYRTNETFREAVQSAWQAIVSTIVQAGQGIWNFLGPLVTDLVNFLREKFNQFREFWNEIWPSLQQAFINIWNGIMAFIRPIVDAFIELMSWAWPFIRELIIETFKIIKGVISGAFNTITGLLKTFAGLFTADWKLMWEGIKQLFVGALEFIWNFFQLWGFTRFIGWFVARFGKLLVQAFKSIADDVVNIFRGMGNRISGIWDQLKKVTKNAINFFIDMVNEVIESFNRLKIDIPDWAPGRLGGRSFGINLRKIPRLAKGALAFGPTLAVVGDNQGAISNPEVIAPLSELENMMAGEDDGETVSVLRQILQAIRAGQNINVLIGRDQIGRAAIEVINDQARRTGRSPLKI